MKHEESRKRNAELRDRFSNGESVESLAVEYGISIHTARSLCRGKGKRTYAKAREILRRGVILREIETLGISGGQCVRITGMNRNTFYAECRRLGLNFKRDNSAWGTEAKDRAKAMAELYRAGCTLQQVGDQFGVTRERVRQLLSKHLNMNGSSGGQSVSAARNAEIRAKKREHHFWTRHGCSEADYRVIQNTPRATVAFALQRRNARARGIAWEMNIWQWWTIWQASGKWSERGRGRNKYVMCRKNDVGPYSPGNVYIATMSHNAKVQPNNPYRSGHPDHERVMREKRARRNAETQVAA